MLYELQSQLLQTNILYSKHFHIDQPEGVVGREEGADAEYELAGEIPELGEETVEEEGESEAAHGDGHADGVDDSGNNLTNTGLSGHTDVGKVGHVSIQNVTEFVGHQQLVNAIFVRGELNLLPPVNADRQRAVGGEVEVFCPALVFPVVIKSHQLLRVLALRCPVVHCIVGQLLIPPDHVVEVGVADIVHGPALPEAGALLHQDFIEQATLPRVLLVTLGLHLAHH